MQQYKLWYAKDVLWYPKHPSCPVTRTCRAAAASRATSPRPSARAGSRLVAPSAPPPPRVRASALPCTLAGTCSGLLRAGPQPPGEPAAPRATTPPRLNSRRSWGRVSLCAQMGSAGTRTRGERFARARRAKGGDLQVLLQVGWGCVWGGGPRGGAGVLPMAVRLGAARWGHRGELDE